jgi:hypothetical protein
MKINVNAMHKVILFSSLVSLVISCNPSSNPGAKPKPTPTPTLTSTITGEENVTPTPTPTPIMVVEENPTPTPESNICQGLSGDIAMEVLVGPADAVGLEPIAVGNIPFSVVPEGEAYAVQGSGSIAYQDVLEAEWGTYTVDFDLDAAVSGVCEGDAQNGALNIVMEMSGEQMVEVRAEGFQGDYPWAGQHTFNLSFPIEEGATAAGEGWTFVLQLN